MDKPDILDPVITDNEWKVLDASKRTHEEILLNNFNQISLKENFGAIVSHDDLERYHEVVSGFKEHGFDLGFIRNFTKKIEVVLKKSREKNNQVDMWGDHNLWILKPAGLSRGRGIEVHNKFETILNKIENKRKLQWVVQKYIENPLLVKNRKFDIRQWIIITDWNPLTIWFYEDCYIRFAGQDYSKTNLEDKYIHLTNNCITSKQKENCTDAPEEDPYFTENMWDSDTFANWLLEKEGRDIWNDEIKKKIKDCTLWSVSSAQDMIENRKGSIE